ncbi:hypothetical protein CH375_22720, partial [Leptospira ellisii]
MPLGKTSAGMYEDLNGALDFNSDAYLKTEAWNRDRMRMVEGMIQGKIGAMDVIMGPMADYSGAMSNPSPAGANMPQYDVGAFLKKYGGDINAAGPSLSQQAYNQVQFVLFGAAPPTAWARANSPDAATFDAVYYNQAATVMGVQMMFLTSIDAICMGMCAFSLAYAAEVGKMGTLNGQVADAVTQIKAQGQALKDKVAELQYLTDINDSTQLFNILKSPEYGLSAADIAMIQKKTSSSTSLKDLVWKTSNTNEMSFNDLTGSDGLRMAGQKAIHDSYGNYIRSSADTNASRADAVAKTAAGATT